MSDTTTEVRRGVRYEVRRARKRYRCDDLNCGGVIEPGHQYLHLTAFPGHEAAPPWDVLRECVDCVVRKDGDMLHHFTDTYPYPITEVRGTDTANSLLMRSARSVTCTTMAD